MSCPSLEGPADVHMQLADKDMHHVQLQAFKQPHTADTFSLRAVGPSVAQIAAATCVLT